MIPVHTITSNVYFILIMVITVVYGTDSDTDWYGKLNTEKECGLTIKEQREILKLNNRLRANECASNMQALTWDNHEAANAYTHAKKCNFVTEQKDGFGPTLPNPLGLNTIAGGSGDNIAAFENRESFLEIIKNMWYKEEKKRFCWGKVTRKTVQKSGNYTQLVQGFTTRLGCGLNKCDTLKGFPGDKPMYFLVCRYNPQQGFHSGKDSTPSDEFGPNRPPYVKGEACSECGWPGKFHNMSQCCSGLCYPKPLNKEGFCIGGTEKVTASEYERKCEESVNEACDGSETEDENNEGGAACEACDGSETEDENNEGGAASRAAGLTRVLSILVALPVASLAVALLAI